AEAVGYARANRSGSLAFDRRLMEAARDVARAKTENRFSADLFLEYGLSKNSDNLPDVYKSPNDHKQLSLGLKVPILDWGLSKGRIKMAESTQELIRTSIEQEQIDFDQEVYLSVMQFGMQKTQMYIAAKSDTVAFKSFQVAKARYMIGKISITDLNLAQQSKDQAHIGYISTLHKYWLNFYNLRKLTLFDFNINKQITVDINKVL
ncbi:MAG: TolC family protein, partial [Bacteroidetes bacterium HGW-Bacteroidetes-22]